MRRALVLVVLLAACKDKPKPKPEILLPPECEGLVHAYDPIVDCATAPEDGRKGYVQIRGELRVDLEQRVRGMTPERLQAFADECKAATKEIVDKANGVREKFGCK